MLQCGAGWASVVLKNQDISKSNVFLEIEHAIAIGPQHVLNSLCRHVGQAICVVRGLDDNFMRADCVHPIVEAEALAVEVALNLKRRELVGDDTHGPVRSVSLQRLQPIGHNFFRCQSLLPWAKRAESCGQMPDGLHGNKVVRPTATLRRNNYPSTDNWVTA